MALQDYCNTTVNVSPVTCDDILANWVKLQETYNVLCCLLEQTIVIKSVCHTENNVTGKTNFDMPAAWAPLSTDSCDYQVYFNGQIRSFEGTGLGEFEWRIDTANSQIVFTDSMGTVNNPGVLQVRYYKQESMSSLLTCV
jgi:hypothetical protein